MKNLGISTFSSVAALLVFLPSNGFAQTIQSQLPGTWLLASCQPAAGSALQTICSNNPTGSLGFSPTGRYTEVVMNGGRPRGDADRSKITPEQYKAIAQGVVAQFGTYSVNEADKTMTLRTDTSLMGGTQGGERKINISLTGDELKATSPLGTTTWKRSGPAFTVALVGQEKTLKQQIQGPWSYAACNSTNEKGEKLAYCANNPKGIMILAGNGNWSGTIVAGGRKDANAPGVTALFGTWSVNEADKTLTRHIVSGLNPALEGKDFTVNISLNGEEMRLRGDATVPGEGVVHLDGTYRRFKQ